MIRALKPERVFIPCCGAFGLATTAVEAGLNPENVVCGDISLYSSALGSFYSGVEIPIALSADAGEPYTSLLSPYMETARGRAAAVIYAMRLSRYLARDRVYEKHLARELIDNAEVHLNDLMFSLEQAEKLLGGLRYEARDMFDWQLDFAADPKCLILHNPPRYCLSPEHRILTADLRWVRAGELDVGDRLLAFDETTPATGRRRLRFADVERSEPANAECVAVRLENGEEIICTTNHPWLVGPYEMPPKRGSGERVWRRADRIKGTWVLRAFDTWEPAASFDAGWLSGIFDGEGSLYQRGAGDRGAKDGSVALSVSQLLGPVQERVEAVLRELDFKPQCWQEGRTRSGRRLAQIAVGGGFAEVARALGTLRPTRLLPKFHVDGRRLTVIERVRVADVQPIGVQEIQSIATSTNTYIGEGYLMHNSKGYDVQFKGLDELFEWDAPEAKQFGAKEPDYQALMDSLAHEPATTLLYYATKREDPALVFGPPWRSVFADVPNVASPASINWIMANKELPPVLSRNDAGMPDIAHFKLFDGEVTPESRLSLVQCSIPTAHYYRELAVHRLEQAFGNVMGAGCLITIDDQVAGVVVVSFKSLLQTGSKENAVRYSPGVIYAFAMPHPRYRKLQKLILMCTVSSWFWPPIQPKGIPLIFESVRTTVYSDKPETKTQRGIYKLLKREELPKGKGFRLIYGAKVIDRTPEQTIADWLAKWGKDDGKEARTGRGSVEPEGAALAGS